MQPGDHHTIYRRALIRVALVTLIFLLFTAVGIFTNQKNRIRKNEILNLRSELVVAAAFVRESLLKHDYQATEVFFNQWFEEHEDWLELEAKTPNGFVVTQRTRQGREHGRGIELVYSAEFAGRKLMDIRVRHDVDKELHEIKLLVVQVAVGFVLLVATLFFLLRGVVKKYLIAPLDAFHEESKQQKESIQRKGVELSERVKELHCLFSLAEIIAAPDLEEDEVIQRSAEIIPPACHYPEITCVRIMWHGQSFTTEGFRETPWRLAAEIQRNDFSQGSIEVFYTEERPTRDEGPFIREEIKLLNHFAIRLGEALKNKKAQQELRSSEEKNRLLLESTTDGIYAIDHSGICTMCNPAAAHMLGYDNPATLIGKNAHGLFRHSRLDGSEYPETECAMRRGLKGKFHADDEAFWREGGTSFPVEYRTGPIYNKERLIGAVISFVDITQRRNVELQLRQAQKLESVGQLAAGIAHEINTPMQYVQNNVTFFERAFKDLSVLLTDYQQLLAESEASLTDEARDHLKNIDLDFLMEEISDSILDTQDGINRVVKIVSAMKEFSHPGSDEKSAIDLNRALESTVMVSRNEWKYVAEMVTDFDPDLPMVPCLPDQLNQVVLNLIINGAYAIKETGASVPDTPGTITISTRAEDDWVELRVSDTGNGIPEEIRDRVFDPFFTTKEVGKGTGQGLAIIHDVVVKKHGGKIDFTTATGKGTTFIIRLPITAGNDEVTA